MLAFQQRERKVLNRLLLEPLGVVSIAEVSSLMAHV
jgi:hypothetical protein